MKIQYSNNGVVKINFRRLLIMAWFTTLLSATIILVLCSFPVNANAKSMYLPTKITSYYYSDSEDSPETNPTVSSTINCKRNKYGMVISLKEKSNSKTIKETYKYTYKKGLLTKVTINASADKCKQTFKYNKKNKLTAMNTYNLKGKLKNKTKYVYKGSKLVKEKYYENNKLKEPRIYKWKNNKVGEYTIDSRNWTRWQKTTYQYIKGKVSLSETDSKDSKYICKYDSKGHIIESETVTSKDNGSASAKTYSTYTFDTKGNVTSKTDYRIIDGKKCPFAKTKYTSYKKYTVPKGDIVLNNHFQDLGCSVYTLVLPKAN